LTPVLNQFTKNIQIDHLIDNNDIITNPDEVKTKTDEIMSQWTRKRNTQPIPPGRWTKQYTQQSSHLHFKQIMDPITTEELDKILKQLPNNKSPGPSRIPNELWKKAPLELIAILLTLFNQCLEHADMPSSWKEAIIILIPKKNQWEGNFMNT